MKRKIGSGILFIFSLVALVISLKLFWNMGIYVDEYNTNPSTILGGDFWLYMEWLTLGLLGMITIISGVKLFQK